MRDAVGECCDWDCEDATPLHGLAVLSGAPNAMLGLARGLSSCPYLRESALGSNVVRLESLPRHAGTVDSN